MLQARPHSRNRNNEDFLMSLDLDSSFFRVGGVYKNVANCEHCVDSNVGVLEKEGWREPVFGPCE